MMGASDDRTGSRMTVTCIDCAAERQSSVAKDGSAKTPMGWRKIEGGYRCGKCQKKAFVGRSIRLRILRPAANEERDMQAMYRALNAASVESNKFANWYLQRLLAADLLQLAHCEGLPKTSGKVKLPPAPNVEWYREGTRLFPSVAPSSLVQQARMVASYYAKERFAALVAMNRNVRSYRWDGLPVIVNAQAWKLVRIDSDRIVLRAQIGPGKSWHLDVFVEGENLQRMRGIADGAIIPGTAVFVRRARAPRPGEAKRVRVWYLRISAQVPRALRRNSRIAKSVLTLGYDAESLLYGSVDDSEDAYEYSGYELRKSIVKYERLDRRRQIDASVRREQWSKRKARRWAADRTAACEKRANKTAAEIDLCAAHLTRWCESHGICEVNFDRSPRGFLNTFPYRRLADRIQTSLENAGIAIFFSGDEADESQVAFAGPGSETGEST